MTPGPGPFFVIFGGPMQDAVWGPLFFQTVMDRFLTHLGDPQKCNNLLHFKGKTEKIHTALHCCQTTLSFGTTFSQQSNLRIPTAKTLTQIKQVICERRNTVLGPVVLMRRDMEVLQLRKWSNGDVKRCEFSLYNVHLY